MGGTKPPSGRTDFASIHGGAEAYVLLTGPFAVRDEAAASLRGTGVTVLRAGRYLGDPVDGFAADWFIRLERPTSDEQSTICSRGSWAGGAHRVAHRTTP